MKKISRIIGVTVFWAVWPALLVYLLRGRRTRLLMVVGDEFLVLRGWLGRGDWSLPGGGLHRGERSVDGLIREVKEETGIVVDEDDIQFLYSETARSVGLRYDYDAYVIKLPKKPTVVAQKYEITDYMWMSIHTASGLSPDAAKVLATWLKAQ